MGGLDGAAVVARSSQNPLHLPWKGWTGHAFTLAAHTGRVWGRPGRGIGSTAEGIDRSVSGRARGPCVTVGWVPTALRPQAVRLCCRRSVLIPVQPFLSLSTRSHFPASFQQVVLVWAALRSCTRSHVCSGPRIHTHSSYDPREPLAGLGLEACPPVPPRVPRPGQSVSGLRPLCCFQRLL